MGEIGRYVNIRTGKLDANAADENGQFPFFTCAVEPLKINIAAYDCECVLVAGNGDLNVKYYNGKFNAYQRTYIIESKDRSILSPKFLFRFIDKSLRQLRSQTKGGVIQYLRINDLTDLKIILPPINDQLHIANILTKAENLISQRKESIRLLDEYLKSTFLEMFGDNSTNKKKWSRVELNQFGKITTGNTPPRNNSNNYSSHFIEWIKTDNITTDKIYVTKATEYLSEYGLKSARTVEDGALLIACIAGSIESVGRSSLTDRRVSFNQQINAIQPNEFVHPLFLYWLFKTSKQYVQNHATKGMKKILTKGEFEKINMIKPPFNLQSRFAKIVEKTEALKVEYQRSLQELENLYGSLSQRAFRGELSFKDENLMIAAEPEVRYNQNNS